MRNNEYLFFDANSESLMKNVSKKIWENYVPFALVLFTVIIAKIKLTHKQVMWHNKFSH